MRRAVLVATSSSWREKRHRRALLHKTSHTKSPPCSAAQTSWPGSSCWTRAREQQGSPGPVRRAGTSDLKPDLLVPCFVFPPTNTKTQDTSCSQKTAANTRGRLCLHLLQASERLVFDRLLSKRDSGALESSRGPGLPAPQVHMLLCELQEFHHFFSLRLLVIIAVHDSVLHQARPLLEATRRSEPNGFS